MPAKEPFAATRLTAFLDKRIIELRPTKTQAEIANEAGFINPNTVSIIKTGGARLPIDRVPALAKALDTDVGCCSWPSSNGWATPPAGLLMRSSA
ncbi:MAG: hypothetical protein B7Z15_15790, partial [Rhizobiales bacterium 32-66-8]